MSIILSIIVLSILVLLGSGCTSGKKDEEMETDNELTDLEESIYEDIYQQNGDVILTVMGLSAGLPVPRTLTLVYENTSEIKCYTYSYHYILEKSINGKWYSFPVLAAGDTYYYLQPGFTREVEINLAPYLFQINADTSLFRIVCIIGVIGYDSTDDNYYNVDEPKELIIYEFNLLSP